MKEMQLFMEKLFRGKKFLKEWDKQFIREGVMQNAMYDVNMCMHKLYILTKLGRI
jgi:hypothetical protein